jgi:predicted RecA/RadA family phage recombinase
MNNFLKPGRVVTYTAPGGGVTTGLGYLIGSLFVVATNTVAAGLPFEGAVSGVFSLAKASGVWTEGQAVYWDNTAKNVTTTASGNTLIGCAAAAQLSGDTSGAVRLNGINSAGDGLGGGGGVQADFVLGTTAPNAADGVLFVSTTGTVTGVLGSGSYVGQLISIVQSVAASSPVGTITGAFKSQAGAAKTTLALGTAVAFIFRGVWDGAAWRQIDALGGTGSSLS